jgi:DNA polymerase-3 subunit beta
MKVRVPTPHLVEAVGHGASVAAPKSPKPVLECVALKADKKSGLSLEATDLDVGLRLRLKDAAVEEEGTVVVPANRLLAVLREVQEPETTMTEREGGLLVETGRSRFRIRTESAEEFPELPYPGGDSVIALPGDAFRTMIRRTIFATAKEAGRFALHGVLFRLADGRLELVATDGRRLARATRALDGKKPKSAKEVKVILGPKGLALLDRTMGETPEVTVAVHERQALFQVGEALVISRLIDGTFPAYEDVIPKTAPKVFRLSAGDFAAGLRRASILTTRDSVSVQFDVSPKTLTIRSRAVEVGEAEVALEVDYDGQPERLGFNPTFLQDALKVMDPAAQVRFEFSTGKAPGKLSDDENYVYVVMPIALE